MGPARTALFVMSCLTGLCVQSLTGASANASRAEAIVQRFIDDIERPPVAYQAVRRLEETIRDLGERFNLDVEDLNLDLGPVGRLH